MTGNSNDNGGINTGGGAYIGGNVTTQGGDFVGRDKVITAGDRGIAVGGHAKNNDMVTGDRNTVTRRREKTLEVCGPLLSEMRQLIYKAGLDERKARLVDADLQAVREELEESRPDKALVMGKLEAVERYLKATVNLNEIGHGKLLLLVEKVRQWGEKLFS